MKATPRQPSGKGKDPLFFIKKERSKKKRGENTTRNSNTRIGPGKRER